MILKTRAEDWLENSTEQQVDVCVCGCHQEGAFFGLKTHVTSRETTSISSVFFESQHLKTCLIDDVLTTDLQTCLLSLSRES